MGTCQWSGEAIRTASTSLRASNSGYDLVTNTSSLSIFRVSARAASQTSAIAVTLTFGMVMRDLSKWRQRPPVPIRPTLRVSFAAKAVAEEPATATAVAPADRRKLRRVCMGEASLVRGQAEGRIATEKAKRHKNERPEAESHPDETTRRTSAFRFLHENCRRAPLIWGDARGDRAMLRLTLRTLLAYLDDTLPPAQSKQIGEKVAESEFAQQTVERIKTVTRRRRL